MELRRYALIVWRWSWLIALGTILAAGSAFVVSRLTTPVYSASTTLLISQAPNNTGTVDFAALQTSERLARTYVELLRTPEVLEQVIAQLGLQVTPGKLAQRVQVKLVRDTQLVQISVEDNDPTLAADIANKIVEVFKAWNEAQQLSRFASLKESLSQQIQQLDKSIAATQAEVYALGAPRSQADEARLAQLQTKLQLYTSNYSSLQNSLAQARLAEAQAISSFKSSSYYSSLKESMNAQIQQLEKDIAATQIELNSLRAPLSPAEETRLAQLQTVLALYSNNYANLQSNLAQVRLVEGQTLNNVVIAQKAQVPTQPIRPRTTTNTVLAAVVGAMLALGVAFLIEYLDDTVKSLDDIEQITGVSTLGVIGYIEGKSPSQQLVAALMPRSPISEAYRMLRTNIESSSVENHLHSLLVTSSSPREGKSITVANLATVLAQAGKRVVVIDSDLRRPTLHAYFGVPNPHGLTTALLDHQRPVQDYLQNTRTENLKVLTSGPLPSNPAELLGSHRLAQIIEELEHHVDLVILDSPPVLAVTDAIVLARQVDATLVVAQSGVTRLGPLMRTLDALKTVNAHLLGVVLNRYQPSPAGYYNYYYYYSDDGRREKRRRSSTHRWPWQRATLPTALLQATSQEPISPSTHQELTAREHKAEQDHRSLGSTPHPIAADPLQQPPGDGVGKRIPKVESVCDPLEISAADQAFQLVGNVIYGRFEVLLASPTRARGKMASDPKRTAALIAEAERTGSIILRTLDRLGFVSGNGQGPIGVRFSRVVLCGHLAAYEVDLNSYNLSVDNLTSPEVLAQVSAAVRKPLKAFIQGGLTYVVELRQ